MIQWEVEIGQLAGELFEPVGFVGRGVGSAEDACHVLLIAHRLCEPRLQPETICRIACREIGKEHR